MNQFDIIILFGQDNLNYNSEFPGSSEWATNLIKIEGNNTIFTDGGELTWDVRTFIEENNNLNNQFSSLDEYIAYTDKMLEINSIAKSRHIWWKIRPHLDYGTLEYRICDVQRSLKRTEMLVALTQALVHSYDEKVKINKNIEDMNYEILNDSFWKATRFGFDAMITDCFDGQKLSILNFMLF